MFRPEDQRKIELELTRGAEARSQGFEGRARVCARRAAGVAIRAYLEARGLPLPGPSAMDLLGELQNQPDLDPAVRTVIDHLLARVDETFALPQEVDLLADARWLVSWLDERTETHNKREE